MDRTKIEEYRFLASVKGKTFSELNPPMKRLIEKLFGEGERIEPFSCDLCNRFSKPDIYLAFGKRMKYISLKFGRSDSIHFETIKSLVLFLRGLGVSSETQKTILLFHYGDGTLDGSGTRRFLFEECFSLIKDRIKKANEELNKKSIIRECLRRFLFRGTEARRIEVDALVFGSADYFVFATKEEIEKHVLSKRYGHIRTLHIGPMTLRPYIRDAKRQSKYPEKRTRAQIKWHYLLSDIEQIMRSNGRFDAIPAQHSAHS